MKRITISNVNLLYLFMAMLLITVGSYTQSKDAETGLLVTEYLLVLLPALLFVKWSGEKMKKVLRLNALPLKEGILVMAITLFCYPVAVSANLIVVYLLDVAGLYRPIPFPVAESAGEYAVLLFVVAVSAGICEEFFFRGVVMRAYERYGSRKAIVWTAVLFGLFHFNLQNLVAPIFLGLIFGYFVYMTDSIYSGILAHAFNNALAVTIGFLSAGDEAGGEVVETAVSSWSVMVGTFITASLVLACGLVAWRLFKRLKRITELRVGQEAGRAGFAVIPDGDLPEAVSWVGFLPLAVIAVLYVLFAFATL